MPNAFRILKPIQKSSKCVRVFRNTGANAFAKNQTRLAYEDKRDLYCKDHNNTIQVYSVGVIPMLKHWRPDNLARGHLSLLHRASWYTIIQGWSLYAMVFRLSCILTNIIMLFLIPLALVHHMCYFGVSYRQNPHNNTCPLDSIIGITPSVPLTTRFIVQEISSV